MILGITGTRHGVSRAQYDAFLSALVALGIRELHHGDCVGTDEQLATAARVNGVYIVAHPPTDSKLRAYCTANHIVLPEKPYLARNRDIVKQCELLLAFPHELTERMTGSGTWATWREAARQNRSALMIFPDGSTRPTGR